jgi:hypothetical protein
MQIHVEAPLLTQRVKKYYCLHSDENDVDQSVQLAEYLQSKGALIIVAMGVNAKIDELSKLSSIIHQWPYMETVPIDLVSNIINSFVC